LFLGFPWRCIKESSDTARFDSFEPSDVHTALIAVVPVIAVAAVCSSGMAVVIAHRHIIGTTVMSVVTVIAMVSVI
jgi:hypothetical protein